MGRPALGQRASGRGRGLKLPRVSPGLSPRLTEGHSPCTWDCWKLFPGAKWKFPATCRRHSRHPLRAWAGPGFPVAWGQPTARPGPPGPSPSRTLLTSKKPYTWQPSFFCSCIFWLKPSRRHCSIVSGFLKAQPRRRYASRTSSQVLQHLQERGQADGSQRRRHTAGTAGNHAGAVLPP